jgi:beta-glucanase (GH16 family)
MKKAMWLAAALAGGWVEARAAGWESAWSEEFNAASVDAATWGFETGYVRNEEAQYYSTRTENSRIENGELVIEALRDGWGGHAYTSASRTTRGKRSFKYGRFEMRARIGVRAGSWPAWWWLPDAGGWPKGGEIDMMEFYQGKCLFNVMDGSGKWTSPTRTVASLGGARWAAEYHAWTMEWDSLRIDLFLDGEAINRYDVRQADGTGPGGSNPFRLPGYMILNQAIGGINGGNPAGTDFPVRLQVDWVRVHKWSEGVGRNLKVAGGAGSGTYLAGAQASLTAGPAPSGKAFDRWRVVSGTAALDDETAPSASLSMPAMDVSVEAAYKPMGTPVLAGGRDPYGVTYPVLKAAQEAAQAPVKKGLGWGGNRVLTFALPGGDGRTVHSASGRAVVGREAEPPR